MFLNRSTMNSTFEARLKELIDHYGDSTNSFAKRIGKRNTPVSNWLGGKKPSFEALEELYTHTRVNLHWLLTGNGEMFLTKSLAFESNESRTNPLTDEEGYKKLELQIAQIRRELISAQAEIAGNRKYIDQLDAYRESQLRNAKQDVMDVESGLEALNEKISQRNNRAEQGI